ncbi:ABC transporter permease subunit [Pleurocapsales cyanobacterium LEGE 06147]|nr:ABC transporter permease subunit [Pleurocapsales cyanobacterium LEGE 06147]
MIGRSIDRVAESNPQLFREIKGRLIPRNIGVASLISIIGQIVISLCYFSELPDDNTEIDQYSRYCFGIEKYYGSKYWCNTDLLNNWQINWQLLWLDLFICTSIISIFALLVVGTYMLIADLAKEETRGTLNFIRLSPPSATTILTGKILGVPVLLYLGILLAFPLHLVAGLSARIPLSLILGFDAVIVASCAFFFSAALLISLTNSSLMGFKPWLGSSVVLLFLLIATNLVFSGYSVHHAPEDWLTLFYPGQVLPYLVDTTYLPHETVDYIYGKGISDLLFYGKPLWLNAGTGIGFVLCNYGLWTYWFWQGLKRRFHNPMNTVLSKQQSYWFTGCFVAVALGFTLQTTEDYRLFSNFMTLQCFLLILFLGLTAALSPHRQTLQDWARYRHQLNKDGKLLWKELIFGEKSPSTVAIALNLLITTVYILPSLVIFPFNDKTLPVFWGLILGANTILLYAAVTQCLLMMKTQKRSIWATSGVVALTIVPVICLGIAGIQPQFAPQVWLFTFLPLVATEYVKISTAITSILGQWLAIALVGFQITRQLRQAGTSETKMLLSQVKQS